MRHNILKRNSTKPERIVYEVLKTFHIPFKHRWIVDGMEIDFLIGKYAIEIDGHDQNTTKNERLAQIGYIPIHLMNAEVTRECIIKLIKNLNVDYSISERCI